MKKRLSILTALLLHTFAAGQQVATPFAPDDRSPLGGGAAYLDLTVGNAGGVTVTGLQVGLVSPDGTTGVVELWKCPTTRVGNEQTPGVWTLLASGAVTACCPDEGASVGISPFVLPAGSYGIAIHAIGVRLGLTSANTVATAVGGLSLPTHLVLTAGEAADALFTSTPIANRTANCKFWFGLGASLVTPAKTSVYGCGCESCPASFHETWPAGQPVDLVGSSWSMIPTGTGWAVIPNLATYVAPTFATDLGLGDDDEVIVTPSVPLPHPCSGTAYTQFTVCSNGFVSLGNGNGTVFNPSADALLNAPTTAWWAWHDFDPSAAGSGHVYYEEIGPFGYLTWLGVFDFSAGGPVGASTVQFQFDFTAGIVHVVFVGTSTLGSAFVTGYSPGGLSPDFGPTDVSATTKYLCCAETSGLHLDSIYRPVFGQPLQFLATHIPDATFLFVGYGTTPSYVGAAIPGSPGCFVYHDWIAWEWAPLPQPTPPTRTVTSLFAWLATLSLPVGLTFFAQGVAFPAPGTTGGWAWSNGVELTVGTY